MRVQTDAKAKQITTHHLKAGIKPFTNEKFIFDRNRNFTHYGKMNLKKDEYYFIKSLHRRE